MLFSLLFCACVELFLLLANNVGLLFIVVVVVVVFYTSLSPRGIQRHKFGAIQ